MPIERIDGIMMPTGSACPARIRWIDTTKALAIILIVLGHTSGLSPTIGIEIYSFHLPLFLLLSGMLTPRGRLAELSSKTTPLLRSYALYGFITYGFWILYKTPGDAGTPVWLPLWGMAYGVSGTSYWMPHNPPLWYFPMYVSCLILAYLTQKGNLQTVAIYSASCALLFFSHLLPLDLPWGIDKALIALLFFKTGQWMKPGITSFLDSRSKLQTAAAALVLLAINLAGSRLNGGVNLNLLNLGNQPLLFLLNAMTGSLAFILTCSLLPENRILSSLSSNTIPIFCLHMVVIRLLPPLKIAPHSTVGAIIVAVSLCLLIALAFDGFRFLQRRLSVRTPATALNQSD